MKGQGGKGVPRPHAGRYLTKHGNSVVILCDLIWHVISRSSVVISITNCYIRFTFTLLYLNEKSLACRTGRVGTVWKSNGSKHGSDKTHEKDNEQTSYNMLHWPTHKHQPDLQHSIHFHHRHLSLTEMGVWVSSFHAWLSLPDVGPVLSCCLIIIIIIIIIINIIKVS